MWIIAGEGDITNIAVSPKYRKQGIASNLLIKLFEMCKTFNCEDITLEVRASNIPAQNLYKKFDFKEEGLRKGYYPLFIIKLLLFSYFQTCYQL